MTKGKFRTIAYWVTTIFGPTSFVIGGVINLMRTEQAVDARSVSAERLGQLRHRHALGVRRELPQHAQPALEGQRRS